MFFRRKPKAFKVISFKPKEDITAYELAICMQVAHTYFPSREARLDKLKSLAPSISRHWEVIY